MEKLYAVLSTSGIISAKMTAGVPMKTSIKTSGYSKKAMVRMPGKTYFPSLGDVDKLYIDESEGIIYLWDADALTYLPIASDWHKINVINGGEA